MIKEYHSSKVNNYVDFKVLLTGREPLSVPKGVLDISAYPLKKIRQNLFSHRLYEEIILPDTITSIEPSAFLNMPYLKKVVIPDSVTLLGLFTFEKCKELIDVKLSNSLKTIPAYCFLDCVKLPKIIIPNSITAIKNSAFQSCSNLKEIIFLGTVYQWNNITKGSNWKVEVPATYVQCSDGQVTL